jgi:6-phosphogluconate dehydrogenase
VKLGLIGLGTMGSPMMRRLVDHVHHVVGFDVDADARNRAAELGDLATTTASIAELVAELPAPRTVWLMLPAGAITESALQELAPHLSAGDLVVDGGNSDFRDAGRRAEELAAHGIGLCDVGVSGGQWGWKTGYGLTAGGEPTDIARILPVLSALAAPEAYAHVGPLGSGHLVKAIHNGVQYAVMQSYAEGYALLDAHDGLDALSAMRVYQNGCSIRSFLLGEIVTALENQLDISELPTAVPDSGMGRWTAEEAIRLAVPTPTLATALHARFASRDSGAAFRVLNAARAQVGGQRP